MMHADNDPIVSTKRCLFPSDDTGQIRTMTAETSSYDACGLKCMMNHQRSSPTSVSQCSDTFSSFQKEKLNSTITMGETGAEVTLAHLSLTTPDKNFRSISDPKLGDVRNSSLLDNEWTPTPPSKETRGGHRGFNFCCTSIIGEVHQEEDQSTDTASQIEHTIERFLEDDSSPSSLSYCGGWQAWSFFNSEDSLHQSPSKKLIQSNLRNRAFDIVARQSRVGQLRHNLSPFSGSGHATSAPDLFRSRSFSISDHAPAIARVSKDNKNRRSSFTNVLSLCTLPENVTFESPLMVRCKPNEAEPDLCYDSDPEDFTRGRTPESTSPSSKENWKEFQKYSYPLSVSSSPTGKIEDDRRDQAFHSVVQEFFNKTSTLIYHPPNRNGTNGASLAPIAVDAWLERGQRLYNMIQPKWMWRPKPRSTDKRQHVIVNGIELLDFTRIITVKRIDRSKYPFAKPRNSFIVQTLDDHEFCFEAGSLVKRDRFVYSLKMVIARFGAKVLMSDETIYSEFFATIDSFLPGETPQLLPPMPSARGC